MGSDQFFTPGLLHEVGHAVMYSKSPEKCLQVIDESETQCHSLIDLERQKFGFDYAQLGRELMLLWQLPKSYHRVAAFHLEPNKADSAFQLEVLIINLANIICQNQTVEQNQS